MAWHSCICTFEAALQAYKSSLLQAEHNLCSEEDRCCSNHIGATLREVHKREGEDAQMVYANLQKLFEKYVGPCTLELKDASYCFSQFFARMSPTLAISNNMILLVTSK